MTRPLCCEGSTYVVPNGSARVGGESTRHVLNTWDERPDAFAEANADAASWAVLCADCDRVLAVVDGPRDEVYACL